MEIGKRDERIDILRAIAILCIFLAHSHPVGFIFQLRNFDVILMVFLMGSSFFLSNQKGSISYGSYVIKRFKRLIVPTWKFLIIFFVLFYLLSLILKDDYYFSKTEIYTSFALTSGIGFVWIMRVFFIVALVSPVLLYISNNIKRNILYFLLLSICYGFYCLMLLINDHLLVGNVQKIFEYYFVEGFGYSLIAALGIRLYNIRKQHLPLMASLFLIIFLILMIFHNFLSTQAFKYPPTLYYFSYGLFVTFILIYLLSINKIKIAFCKKPIMFLSYKSLDLYYCHIIPVYFIQLYGNNIQVINDNFIFRFIFILVGAYLLLSLQMLYLKVKNSLKRIKRVSK
jgi:peptidoglycan/LPS O-acetylase OafA/YrhL